MENEWEEQLGEKNGYYRLLRLFSFGEITDYTADLPKMTEKQKEKLQKLTVLSMAKEESELSFSEISKKLKMSKGEAEKLIFEMINQRLVNGKISQREGKVRLFGVVPRDVDDEEAMRNISRLEEM